jgi:hypothetical protein
MEHTHHLSDLWMPMIHRSKRLTDLISILQVQALAQ